MATLEEWLRELAYVRNRAAVAETEEEQGLIALAEGNKHVAAGHFDQAAVRRNNQRKSLERLGELTSNLDIGDGGPVDPEPGNTWDSGLIEGSWPIDRMDKFYLLHALEAAPAGEVKNISFVADFDGSPESPSMQNKFFYICNRKGNGSTEHQKMVLYAFTQNNKMTFRMGWDLPNADKTKDDFNITFNEKNSFSYYGDYPGTNSCAMNTASKIGEDPLILPVVIGNNGLYATWGGIPGEGTNETSPVGCVLTSYKMVIEYKA